MKTIITLILTALSLSAQITICQTEGNRCDPAKTKVIPADVLASIAAFRASQATPSATPGGAATAKYETDWDLIDAHIEALIDSILDRHPTAKVQARIDARKAAEDAEKEERQKALTRKQKKQ